MVHLPHLPEVAFRFTQVLHFQFSCIVIHKAFDLPQLLLVILFSFSLKTLHFSPEHGVLLLQHLDLAGINILLVLAHLVLD